jgi:hypothetical protein
MNVERLRRLPVLIRDNWKNSATFQEYTEQTRLVLKVTQKVSGCSIKTWKKISRDIESQRACHVALHW